MFRRSAAYPSSGRWLRFGLAFLGLGVIATPLSLLIDGETWWVHGAWCVAGIGLALPILSIPLRHGFAVILTEHPIMLVAAFTVYFLFGALLLSIGPADEIQRVLAFYPINARDAMRVDAVNGIGLGLALMAAALSRGNWLGRHADRLAKITASARADVTVFLFLLLGTAASIHVLSVDLGLREGVVAGVWRAAGQFVLVAIFLGAAHQGRCERSLKFVAVVVALVETVGGLLLFSKAAALLPGAALIAGLSVRYRRRFILPLGAAALAVVFVAIGGLMSFGRTTLGPGSADVVRARWRILGEGLSLASTGSSTTTYDAWGRLSYTPSQTAAMNFYDAGIGGNEFRLIPWLFVPRALVPSKPIITQSSVDFHSKITGRTGSSTGQGIFISGYYNAGWLGVLFASLLCGWILAQTSAIARAVLFRRALLLLPLALLGVHMAFRIDGHFVADYIGPFIFVLYALSASMFFVEHRRGVAP